MTLDQLISQIRARIAERLATRNGIADQLAELRTVDGDIDAEQVTQLREQRVALDAEIDQLQARAADLEAERAADQAAASLAESVAPAADRPAYDGIARVGREARTYSPDTDRHGTQFLRDVAASFIGSHDAGERLARHMAEERVERGDSLTRAVGTGAFTGLVVPQYAVDLFALPARAGRPFADACHHIDLPSEGMTVNIGRGTTGTSAAEQTELADVDETDFDDTLLTLPVRTAAGSQTVSRQAAERGAGIDETLMRDLFNAYATSLDSTLINKATVGLSAAATSITYTDTDPTAAELHPKLLAAASAVEGSLLNIARPDLVLMHSRRWYWLLSQIGTSFPFMNLAGVAPQVGGVDYAAKYGAGFRGMLPNGMAVVTDNNITTAAGAGTNQDEVFVAASEECHLWEDPNAPMFIRAEAGPNVKKLAIDLVVYGYFAFTFGRYAGTAAKINGTGLITPTF